jgi:hypothetical protein
MRWLVVLAMVMAAGTAAAESASSGGYSLRVEDENGAPLPTFEHDGSTYVLGNYGQRYNVRLFNQTGHRVEAVVSVDGRDVLTGDAGDYVHQRGYVIPAYGSVRIEGFRQSYSDVAAFRFTSPGDSYSARRGTPQNVGVVGVAIFRERRNPPPPPRPQIAVPRAEREPMPSPPDDGRAGGSAQGKSAEAPRSADETGGAAPSAAPEASRGMGTTGPTHSRAPAGGDAYDYDWQDQPSRPQSQNNLGTQYGETRYSPVTEVQFVRARADRPDRVLTVYYDDARGLASRGIPVRPSPWTAGPAAFPENDRRFAPPPP